MSIKYSFDLNHNKSSDNTVLIIKENKSVPNEFLVVNSDYTLNYYRITESDVLLLNTYNEHQGRINDLTFFHQNQKPFETCFITASTDMTIKIWDYRSKESAHTLICKYI